MKRTFRQLAIAVVLLLVAMPLPALAEGGDQTTSNTPAGLGVLLLVMGLAAIFLVGGYYVSQNRPASQQPSDFDDDE